MGLEPRQPDSTVCAFNHQLCCLSVKTSLVINVFFPHFASKLAPYSFCPGVRHMMIHQVFSDKLSCLPVIFSSPAWQSLVRSHISHVAWFPCSWCFPWLYVDFRAPGEKRLRLKVKPHWAGISAAVLTRCIYLSRYFVSLSSRGPYICEMGLILSSLGHCKDEQMAGFIVWTP